MYIRIEKNPDGGHAFQFGGALENGWAVVPSDLKIPDSFPYVDIEVGSVTRPSIDGGADIVRMEVLSMTAGEIPEEVQQDLAPGADAVLNTLLGVNE